MRGFPHQRFAHDRSRGLMSWEDCGEENAARLGPTAAEIGLHRRNADLMTNSSVVPPPMATARKKQAATRAKARPPIRRLYDQRLPAAAASGRDLDLLPPGHPGRSCGCTNLDPRDGVRLQIRVALRRLGASGGSRQLNCTSNVPPTRPGIVPRISMAEAITLETDPVLPAGRTAMRSAYV